MQLKQVLSPVIIGAVLTAGLGLGAAASADPRRGPSGPIDLSALESRTDARFDRIDTDGDGSLSAAEFAAVEARPGAGAPPGAGPWGHHGPHPMM
jgi:hypothetical protein